MTCAKKNRGDDITPCVFGGGYAGNPGRQDEARDTRGSIKL